MKKPSLRIHFRRICSDSGSGSAMLSAGHALQGAQAHDLLPAAWSLATVTKDSPSAGFLGSVQTTKIAEKRTGGRVDYPRGGRAVGLSGHSSLCQAAGGAGSPLLGEPSPSFQKA